MPLSISCSVCFSSLSPVTGNSPRASWLVSRPADLLLLSPWEFRQGPFRRAVNYAKTLRWWRKSAPSRRCSGSPRSLPPPPRLRTPPAVHLSEAAFSGPAARGSYISNSFQVGGVSSTVNQLKLKWWDGAGGWSGGVVVSGERAWLKLWQKATKRSKLCWRGKIFVRRVVQWVAFHRRKACAGFLFVHFF